MTRRSWLTPLAPRQGEQRSALGGGGRPGASYVSTMVDEDVFLAVLEPIFEVDFRDQLLPLRGPQGDLQPSTVVGLAPGDLLAPPQGASGNMEAAPAALPERVVAADDLWRAGCGEGCTSDSEGRAGEMTGRDARDAPRSDPRPSPRVRRRPGRARARRLGHHHRRPPRANRPRRRPRQSTDTNSAEVGRQPPVGGCRDGATLRRCRTALVTSLIERREMEALLFDPVTINDLRRALDSAARDHWLLDHPYYRSWVAGELTVDDLADYAAQYRHFEAVLPATLAATAAQLPPGAARCLVEENLADEQTRPRPHLELLEGFASSVGADTDRGASPATAELVATYRRAEHAGPVAALSVVGAYEVQAAEIASTKAATLRSHYQLPKSGTEFWDVHAQLEDSHADWTAGALEEVSAAPEDVYRFGAASAEAWWMFLDEREAVRGLGTGHLRPMS